MFDLRIAIPPPDTTAFERGFDRVFSTLDQADRRLRRIDRQVGQTGRNFGRGGPGAGGGGGGNRRGGPPSRRPASLSLGGNSGSAANIARAAGVGGPLANAIGAGAIAGGIITVVAGIREAINVSKEFETRLNEIGRVAKLSGEDLAFFGDQVVQLSQDFPVATERIFQLASAGANAGLRAADLAAFTEEMTKLATILPEINDNQVRGILRLGQLTNFPVDRIGELNGALVALQQNSKVTLPALIKLSQRVAQDAGIFGITTEEVAALAATIGDLGLQPERASTAIGRIIGEIKQLDSASSDTIENILSTFRNAEEVEVFRNLAVDDPIEALRRIAEESTNFRQVLTELGVTGKQNIIGQNVLQNFETFNRLREQADPNEDIIDDQVNRKLTEFNSQLKIFTNTFREGFQNFGSSFIQNVALPVIKFINEAISRIQVFGRVLIRLGDLDFRGALNILDGTEEREITERLRNLTNTFNEERELLEITGRQIIENALNPRFVTEAVDVIDGELAELKEEFRDALLSAGADVEQVNKLLENFTSITSQTRFAAELKRATDEANRLGAALSRSEVTLKDILEDVAELEFEVRISDLDQFDADLERALRESNQKFNELLGTDILRPDQIKSLQDKIAEISADLRLEIDLGASAEDVVSQLDNILRNSEEFTNGQTLAIRDALTAAERIAVSGQNIAALQRQRNLELDLLLKKEQDNIRKERENIQRKNAPQNQAITDAGAALELVNQLQFDQALREEELQILDGILEAAEEQVEVLKQQNNQVLGRPPGT